MSSAALADKHVDSFGPELLNEAWRGRLFWSPPTRTMFFFLSALGRAGDWTEWRSLTWFVGDGGVWGVVVSPFPAPFSCLPSYGLCHWSGAGRPWPDWTQFLNALVWAMNLLWVGCDSFWGWTSIWEAEGSGLFAVVLGSQRHPHGFYGASKEPV